MTSPSPRCCTTATLPDPLIAMDLCYVIVEEVDVRRMVAWLMGDCAQTTALAPADAIGLSRLALETTHGVPPLDVRAWETLAIGSYSDERFGGS